MLLFGARRVSAESFFAISISLYLIFLLYRFLDLPINRYQKPCQTSLSCLFRRIIRLFLLRIPPDYSALPSSCSAGCHPALSFCVHFRRIIRFFFLVSSAGLNPAFICSRSTLSCAREFRERVSIAFSPSLSCVRHLRWRVFLLPPVLFSSPIPFKKYIIYLYII